MALPPLMAVSGIQMVGRTQMVDATTKVPRQSRCFALNLITEEEFATSCFAYMRDDPDCDPVAILSSLPEPHRSLIVDFVREFAKQDFYLAPTEWGSESVQRQYQVECKRLGLAILQHFPDV